MTRKDYIRISGALRAVHPMLAEADPSRRAKCVQYIETVHSMADALSVHNNFNRALFFKACGVQEES